MKKTHCLILTLFLAVFVSLFGTNLPVQASEGGGDGQVTRGGKIIFYDETQETQASSSTEASTAESSIASSTDAQTVAKPIGRFPKTGELIQQYGWVGGVILLLLLGLLFLRNGKKEEQK